MTMTTNTLYNIIRRAFLSICMMASATIGWAADVSNAGQLKEALAGNDGTITLISDISLSETLTIYRGVTLNLNGHNITANGCRAFHITSGDVTITSDAPASIHAYGSIAENSSVIRVGTGAGAFSGTQTTVGLTINENVTISTNQCYGITVFGSTTKETLIVKGKVTTKGVPAISGHGNAEYAGTTIIIDEKAEITTETDVAIYHPQAGTLTVRGNAIVTGAGGIEIKAGDLIIEPNAQITATGAISHTVNNDGTSTRGYAIAIVENGLYAGVNTINVSKQAVIEGPVAVVKDSENATTQGVVFNPEGLQATINVIEDSKVVGRYMALDLAMSEAPVGSTVKLLADCNITGKIITDKNITLDLDGKNIACKGDGVLHIKGGNVTITSSTDATISSTGTVAGNGAVIRLGDDDGGTRVASLTVDANVTISSEVCSGISVFGCATTETLTVNGKVTTPNHPAINGNGSASGDVATITIAENATVSSTNNLAIYKPQGGSLTVNGNVSGNGGIELKGGTLTVNSTATVTSTGTPAHTPSITGNSSMGYAIAIVENSAYALVTDVTIDDNANISGPIAQLQDSELGSFNPTYTGNKVANKVASIEKDKYFTLKDAINIVPSAGTVKLLGNLTMGTSLVMDRDKTYTLDLAGYTLTGNDCAALQITHGHVTIANSGAEEKTVTVSGTAPEAAILLGDAEGSNRNISLTISSKVKIDGGTLASGILVKGDKTREALYIHGKVSAVGHSAIVGADEGNLIDIAAEAEVTASNAVVIYHPQSGELTVKGSVIGTGTTAGAIEMKGGNLTVAAGATVTACGSQSHTKNNEAPSTNGYCIALVENPAFTGVGKVDISESAHITGVIACIIDEKNNSVAEPMFTGHVTMVAETNISEGRGDKYDTLPHAIDAAANNSVVKLLDDLTVTETIAIRKPITLNMDDYSLINNHASDPAVSVRANVTIKNGGIVSVKTGDPKTYQANKGISITSGTVSLQQVTVETGGVSLDISGGEVTANNASTFTSTKSHTAALSGGSLTFAGKMYNVSTEANKNAMECSVDADLTIEDASVVSSTNGKAVNWNSTGTLTVNGGKISGAEAVNASNGSVTISGGTFTGTGHALEVANASCHASITGGSFVCGQDGSYLPIKYTPGTPASGFVSGVNTFFSKAIAQNLCQNGYMVSQRPKNNGMYYLIDEIVITDGADWNQPTESFTIRKAKYIRNSGMGAHGTQFGTLCLPFSYSSTQTGMTFYTVNRIDGNTLYLDAVASGDIAAGTPVVFKFTSATTNFTIESTDATISNTAAGSAGNLVGTFAKAVLTTGTTPKVDGVYYLNSDAFHQANETLTVPAYRAYIQFASSARPRVLYIHTDDDDTNAVDGLFIDKTAEVIYDMQGRRQNNLQPGINIIKMSNGRTIKVYVNK